MLKLSNPEERDCIIIMSSGFLEIYACVRLSVILKVMPYMESGVNWVKH